MKEIKTLAASKKVFKTFALWMLLYIPLNSFAQTDSTKKEAPAAAEAPSLISPSVSFLTVQKSDNTIDLKAALKAKINGSSKNLELLKISYVLVTDSIEKPLGFVITDRNGKAVLNIKADSLKADKEGKLHFKALFAGNKAMEAAEGEVSIKRARLEITPVKGDSTFSVTVKLIDLGTGAETPIPETVLGVFVGRLFFPLKVGEGTTDATGEVSVEIPKNLPGDTKGNITLLAKIDENELYGNLEASVTQPWGVRVSDQLKELPRSLWSPHPPIWMLATFIILMAAVWGHYIVIVVQLFRLRKEEPQLPVGTA
jgi:hypothetical protein